MKKKTQKNSEEKISYTQQLRQQRLEREFWSSYFGIADINEIPEHFDHVKLRSGSITDSGLWLIAGKIKSIGMLDIYEAEITADGIEALTKMDSIQELRLKECKMLDNVCMDLITQINGLELLHVGGTSIDLDGLEHIGRLSKLKTLIIPSLLNDMAIAKRIQELQSILPGCEFIVNHRPPDYYLEKLN